MDAEMGASTFSTYATQKLGMKIQSMLVGDNDPYSALKTW